MTVIHKKTPNPGERKRKMVALSNMDIELWSTIKLYAASRNMPIYKAIEHLVRRGFEAESTNSSIKDTPVDIIMVARSR